MRKFFVGLLIAILFLGIDVLIARALKPHAPNAKEAVRQTGVDVLARLTAEGLQTRLGLPKQVDEVTTLEDITSQGDKIIYSMSFNVDDAQFNALMSNIVPNMQQTGCTRADYRKLMSFGLTIVLDLHSATGTHVPPLTFTPQGCGL